LRSYRETDHLLAATIVEVKYEWRMVSSGMLRRVAFVRTDVSEELSASFIRVTASVVHSSPILVTLIKEALSSSETSVRKRAHTT
jgi:hypothetical protein